MNYMRFDSIHNKQLNFASIEKINEGLLVLKHFFEINEKLLPIFYNLSTKEKQTAKDLLDIQKISLVIDSYNFDVNTSKVLLNSDILDLLQNAYINIQNENCTLNEKQISLSLFLQEYALIKNKWKHFKQN